MGASFGAELRSSRAVHDRGLGGSRRARSRDAAARRARRVRICCRRSSTTRTRTCVRAAVYVAGVQTSDGAKAVAAAALKDAQPVRQAPRGRSARAPGPDAEPAELRAGGRHLRAARESRPVRALRRPSGAGTHAAHRVGEAGDGRDQCRRAHRRPARADEHASCPRPKPTCAPIFDKLIALMKRRRCRPNRRSVCCGPSRSPRRETRNGVDPRDPQAGPRRADRAVPGARRRPARGLECTIARSRPAAAQFDARRTTWRRCSRTRASRT